MATPARQGQQRCKGTFNSTLQRSFSAIDTPPARGRSRPCRCLPAAAPRAATIAMRQAAPSATWSCGSASRTCSSWLPPATRPSAARGGGTPEPVDRLRPELLAAQGRARQGCGPTTRATPGRRAPSAPRRCGRPPSRGRASPIQTGDAANQVPAGLNMRILGTDKPNSCTSPEPLAQLPTSRGDPRIVQVFLTPFGSFDGSGSGTVPVKDFAFFYVTGWTGQGGGFNNPCQGNGDDPVPERPRVDRRPLHQVRPDTRQRRRLGAAMRLRQLARCVRCGHDQVRAERWKQHNDDVDRFRRSRQGHAMAVAASRRRSPAPAAASLDHYRNERQRWLAPATVLVADRLIPKGTPAAP